MLVASGSTIVAIAPDGTRSRLLTDAQDAAYSPDGTMIAFARSGDLWTANADGSGQRRLESTPNVEEWGPSWSPDGHVLVYSARVDGQRQIRLVQLPAGPTTRIAPSDAEEWSPAFSRNGRLAFVSSRGGTPAVYTSAADGKNIALFDVTPPEIPPADVRDLAWSPDGKRLAYTREADDGTTNLVVDDGTTQVDLTPPLAQDEHPVWSPTGSRVAYDDGSDNLRSVAADGTDQRALGEGRPLDWRVVPIGKPLYPNLVQRPPSGLLVTAGSHGRWLLGFTSMVDNRGPGILWIRGTRHGHSHVMDVEQLLTLQRRRHAGAARVRRAALHRRSAALPLALPRLRPLRAAQRRRVQAPRARPQERLLHRRPLRDRAGRPARPAALPVGLRAVPSAGALRRRGLVGGLHRPVPGELPRPEPRRDEGARRALLARAPRESRLPPARDALRRRRGVDPRAHRRGPAGTAHRRRSRRCASARASAASSSRRPASSRRRRRAPRRSSRSPAGTRSG